MNMINVILTRIDEIKWMIAHFYSKKIIYMFFRS